MVGGYQLIINHMEQIMNTQTHIERLLKSEVMVKGGTAHVADIPLRTPMKLPFAEISSRPSGIAMVKMSMGEKENVGFGEGATLPQPLFTDDSGGTIAQAGQHIIDTISGRQMSLGEMGNAIQLVEFEEGKQFPTARMMVEMAVLDGVAKAQNKSMNELLGVPSQVFEVPFGKSIGGGTVHGIMKEARSAVETGAKKIKIKITPKTTPDVMTAIHKLRGEFADLELMVDANGTFNPGEKSDLSLLKEVDVLGLIMIEEPVSRTGDIKGIEAVRRLRRAMQFKTSICLDDCLIDLPTTQTALDEGLGDVINIKPGRIGSIIGAIYLAEKCKKIGKEIMVGGMLEATPGRCMTTVLAALFHSMGFTIPGDLSLAQERLATDIVAIGNQLQIGPQGGILLPNGTGWGFGDIEMGGN